MRTIFYLIVQLFLFSLVCTNAFSYDFQSGLLYYNINADMSSVSVTSGEGYNDRSMSFWARIPDYVEYNYVSYPVTGIEDEAFFESEWIRGLEIGANVTQIGSRAFVNCRLLREIAVSESNHVFDSREDCNAVIETESNSLIVGCITSLIPSTVTKIGDESFRGNGTFWWEDKKLTIPNSVTTIGFSAFSDCDYLEKINIPQSVTSIGNYSFFGCDLDSITVEEGNKTYDSRDGCNAIIETATNSLMLGCNNTVIPEGIENIVDYAFAECKSLTLMKIPDTVTSIGKWAFKGCSQLQTAKLSKNLKYIDIGCFKNCSNLISIKIPNSVTFISRDAFEGCGSLTKLIIECLTPPRVPVTSFHNAFYNADKISLYVPVESINAYKAVETWSQFKEIIPFIDFADENVKNICLANWDTDNDGVLTVEEAAAVTSLGGVFNTNCDITSFNELRYFTGLKSIDDNEFYFCRNLSSIELPSGLESIGSRAFCSCKSLTSITIPEGVRSIGFWAFMYCEGLTSIDFPESLTTVDRNAFSLTAWYNNLPDGLRYVGCIAYAYIGAMPDKTAIILEEGTKVIGESAFYGCTGLTSITIPEGVTSICDDAFHGCSGLTSITIPEGVTTIGEKAFQHCSGLTSITIPESVTSIGDLAFADCDLLKSVHIQCSKPIPVNASAFSNRTNQTLYVPVGTKAAYEEATLWKDFKEIIEEGGYIAPNAVAACPGGLGSSFSLDLRNGEPIVGVQFDLQLPEGVSLVTDSKGNYVASLSKRKEDHGLSVSKISDNTYRFVAVSMNNKAFTGTEGALLDIKMKVADSVALGDYEVKVMNTELTAADMHLINSVNKFSILTVKDAEPGDVNGDMKVSVTDVVSIIDDILNNTPSIFIRKAADVNGDNNVSVTDAIIVIDMILNEGKEANVKRNKEPQ